MMEIPGYYYDENQKRYFKILSSGLAAGSSSSKYSISALASKKIEQQSKENVPDVRQTFTRSSYVNRSRFGRTRSQHPQHGNQTAENTQVNSFSLCRSWSIPSYVNQVKTKKGKLFLGCPHSETIRHPTVVRLDNFLENEDDRILLNGVFATSSTITDLVLNDLGDAIVCSIDEDPDKQGFQLVLNNNNNNNNLYGKMREFSSCCAMARQKRIAMVGIGSSLQSFRYDNESVSHVRTFNLRSDVFAIDFLDHARGDLALIGLRNGRLQLIDARQSSELRALEKFNHGSSVTGIKCVQNGLCVVTGLQDKMSLYDLRMIREYHEHDRVAGQRSQFSDPLLSYKGYKNQTTRWHGLAATSSSVAVANNDKSIEVYEILSGHSITSKSMLDHASQRPGVVTCLDFIQDDTDRALGLLAVCETGLLEYWTG